VVVCLPLDPAFETLSDLARLVTEKWDAKAAEHQCAAVHVQRIINCKVSD